MSASSGLTPGQRLRLGLMNRGASALGLLGFGGLESLGAGLGRLMWACLPGGGNWPRATSRVIWALRRTKHGR